MKKDHRSFWIIIKDSVWTFPVVLFLILLVLTSLKISGTSIGIYHNFFYGDSVKDSNLVFGDPRSIRSDEWLVTTQLTIAQERQGYPRINENIINGKDMSLIGDVPYKEWSAIFRPQNLAFFILPLEYAFAFKWWLLLFLLIVSCYFFTLKLLPKKRLLSALLATGFGLSPFVWWWYVSGTMAPLFYGFFILTLLMRIINKEKIPIVQSQKWTDFIHLGLLSYLLTSFALVMYPPYQIPIAIAVSLFFVGYIFKKLFNDKNRLKVILPDILNVAVAGLVAIVIVTTFFLTRLDTMQAINNTAYPGGRITNSGGLNYLHIFNSFLQPQLQYEPQGQHFFKNQSESSNFILVFPFLLIPGFVILLKKYRKEKQVDWLLLVIQMLGLFMLARVFIPLGDPFYKLLLLDKVPHERLLIGLGFIGFIQMILIIKALANTKIRNYWPALIYCSICFATLLVIGFSVRANFPMFVNNPVKITLAALTFAIIPALILWKKFYTAAILILLFSIVSVWRINPLYSGLGLMNNNQIFQAVQASSQPNDTWVATDKTIFENFGLLSNRDSISGVNLYPDVEFWRQAGGSQYDDIYNRYAHIVFTNNQSLVEPFKLQQLDLFVVKLDCSQFILQEVEYAVSYEPITLPCADQVDKIQYPLMQFYLYKIN